MAKQLNNISGGAGPLIFYTRNGTQCIRTRPAKVKQTAATKKRSFNFGIAARAAKATTDGLAPLFLYKDGTRYIRLTSAYSRWLRSGDLADIESRTIQTLKDFDVNPPKMPVNKWAGHITVSPNSAGLLLDIATIYPEDMMPLPQKTVTLKLTLASMILQPAQAGLLQQDSSEFLIPVNGGSFPARLLQHELNITPGSVLLSGYAVTCLDAHGLPLTLRKGYSPPAGIWYAEWKRSD